MIGLLYRRQRAGPGEHRFARATYAKAASSPFRRSLWRSSKMESGSAVDIAKPTQLTDGVEKAGSSVGDMLFG